MRKVDYDEFRKIPLPTEQQIMASWLGNPEQPLVSIICTTFNQKNFIEDALRGFLIQKTCFPFEIIIQDDASTDGTREIVQNFAEQYPSLIKPILQQTNQCSQGKKILLMAAKAAKGEYIALCEGDDFWIDENKISIQVEALAANSACNICFHKCLHLLNDRAEIVLPSFQARIRQLIVQPRSTSIIKTNAVIIGDGAYMPTASILVRRSSLLGLPEWFFDCPVEDFFIQTLCSYPAGALFIPREMSIYRINVTSSWTTSTSSSAEKALTFYARMMQSLERLDNHFNRAYTFEINSLKQFLTIINSKYQHKTLSPSVTNELPYLHRWIIQPALGLNLIVRLGTLARYNIRAKRLIQKNTSIA